MAFVMLVRGLAFNGVSNPKPQVAFSLSASLFYNLASLQAKPPCLDRGLVVLAALPASPTVQTMVRVYCHIKIRCGKKQGNLYR